MTKNWFARFGSADRENITTTYNINPDVAEAFIAATQRSIADRTPRHAETFLDHTATIAQATRVIQAMEELRERSIAAADATSPNADRKAIGVAAAMPPSRVYRVLEKYGRPRKRRPNAEAPPA